MQKICEILEVLRSSHFLSLQIAVSNREQENQELTKEIHLIYLESKGRYGAPKIHESLLTKGFSLSLKRVQRLMSKARIRSITKKKYRPYPSKEKVIQSYNLLKNETSLLRPLMRNG